MGLYIKGLDMPKNEITIKITQNGEVWEMSKVETEIIGRISYYGTYCQAVEILTPHGRLIDGDKLNIEVHSWSPAYSYGRGALTRAVENAPTILEAEE